MTERLCKICDVRDFDTAAECAQRGVRYLGLHCIDALKPERQEAFVRIAAELPRRWPGLGIVMVTRVTSVSEIARMVKVVRPTHVQLHNEAWTGARIQDLQAGLKDAVSARVGIVGVLTPSQPPARYSDIGEASELVIVDSSFWGEPRRAEPYSPKEYMRPVQLLRELDVPVLIAGGITPSTVKAYIEQAAPSGVDIQRGVKQTDGKRIDIQLVQRVLDELNSEG